ncbi:hypothetical protein FEM48_Zijuj07G0112200 [Ziziphus jujuba var. spinosa]|nr:hypothetical protein FEM48_Zijuj07G0112200 [Ziziphus jujuba var. spinosa]
MDCDFKGGVRERTLAITNLLSNYPLDAKAVLSVAALALEFEDFCRLHQHINDPVTCSNIYFSQEYWNSVAILKRVTAPTDQQSLYELKNLVVVILEVTRSIFELEKVRTKYTNIRTDVLAVVLTVIQRNVYWTIATVVACATQISKLKSFKDQPYDLSQWREYLNSIHEDLKNSKRNLEQEKEKEVHLKLSNILESSHYESHNYQITEVLNLLIEGDTNVKVEQRILIKSSINSTAAKRKRIEMLRTKDVLLLISSMDISHDDTAVLKSIYEQIESRKYNYEIVWIPIVEQWNVELHEKFCNLKNQMPWYVLELDSHIAGIEFIKEKWNFTGKTIAVLMNSQGKVENHNALEMISLWGMDAFPFTKESERTILQKEKNWLRLVTKNTHPNIETWMKEEKYIFLYGGTDQRWIKKFGECLENVDFTKFSDRREGNNAAEQNDGFKEELFWILIERLNSIRVGEDNIRDDTGKELEKLLSYKKADRWVLLSKGPSVIIFGHGTLFLRALKELVKVSSGEGFNTEHTFETQMIKHYDDQVVIQQEIQSFGIKIR